VITEGRSSGLVATIWAFQISRHGVSPNTRVQRTRSSPSAPHSPLTRHPLGRFA
jgi:hypothetical protein